MEVDQCISDLLTQTSFLILLGFIQNSYFIIFPDDNHNSKSLVSFEFVFCGQLVLMSFFRKKELIVLIFAELYTRKRI